MVNVLRLGSRVVSSCAIALAAGLRAQTPPADLRGMLPAATVAMLEVADPALAVAELRAAIGELPESLPDAVRVPLWLGLVGLWTTLQGNPEAWADRTAGGGAVLGWLPATGRLQPFALLRPRRMDAARAWLARFADRVAVEVAGDVLVVAADPALGARVAAAANGPASRWASVDLGAPAAVRFAADLAALRQLAGPAAPHVAALDAGGRFLLAPIVHALETGQWLRAALAGGPRLTLTAHVDAGLGASPFAALLPAPDAGPAVALPADGLASLRVDRSVRALLEAPERFLPPDGVQAVRGFLSIADAIDGVRTSFVADLLGGLGEPFELHVLPVTPVAEGVGPRLQLPGFAVVAALRDPAAEAILFRAAQVFVLIANAERAQRGQSLFTARLQRSDGGRGLVAEPMPWRGPGAPPIEQALSPTVWSENGIVVLASTRAAAQAMVAAASPRAVRRCGDHFVLRGPATAQALAASRTVFELGRVLDEGEDRATAARFFDTLIVVAEAVRELTLHVDHAPATTTLELTMERAR